MTSDTLYLIGITNIPNVGAVKAKQLIAHCGSANAVFKEKKGDLMRIPGIGSQIASDIKASEVLQLAEKQVRFAEENDIRIISYLDEGYPHRLKHVNDSPVTIYFKGSADINHSRMLAIVGTRNPTTDGCLICEKFVEDFKIYDVQIVSGLAYGIDIQAHRKCLEMNIPTIGVLAHGLDRIYPWQHRKTANAMVEHGGLLTEFPINTRPDKENFPMRNRLIAAMCDAILVVESAESGGSIITANLGNDYHKDVFAVPGRIGDQKSKGCNILLKTHKALLSENAEDIAKIMRWEVTGARPLQTNLFSTVDEKGQEIIELLHENGDMHIDLLCNLTKLTPSLLAAQLLDLEFKGMIKTLPGKRYLLC